MADVLIDTDVWVDHLRGHARFRPGRDRVSYSVLTRVELFAGRGAQEGVVRTLLAPFAEVELSREIAETAGTIRRDHAVPLADAVVAATALAGGMVVVTRNRRHFEQVPGVRVRAPRGPETLPRIRVN
ncbi:MAG: PIN domain-containing protein [Actinobacteria bacterium]|nr:PIN domain-containing protein [Actinomycetota bacterium]